MKRLIKTLVSTLCIVFIIAFFQNCNTNDDSNVLNTYGAELAHNKNDEIFIKDLKNLLNKQSECNLYLYNYVASNIRKSKKRAAAKIDIDTIKVVKEMCDMIENICSTHNLTSDIDSKQLADMQIDEDEIEKFKLDHELYYSYIKKYKTPTFCAMLNRIFNEHNVLVSDVIYNQDLKLNEKLSLALIVNSIGDLYTTDFQMLHTYEEKLCDEDYAAAVNDCQVDYAVEVTAAGFTAASGPVTGGVTEIPALGILAYGTVKYFICINRAGKNYEKCLERAKNKR